MKDYIRKSIQADKIRIEHYKKMTMRQRKLKLNSRYDKRTKKRHYFIRTNNKEVYVRREDMYKVAKLQQDEFARRMIRILEHNIRSKEEFIESLMSDDPTEIIAEMPESYRPDAAAVRSPAKVAQSESTYMRENLTIKTSFGLYVRSKGELAIAELLYSLGIEFYYEKRLNIWSLYHRKFIDYFPDFTIVLPNGQVLYWEHEGLMTSLKYAEYNARKLMDYNHNKIFQSRNLIVTAEGPDNVIDMEGIRKIVYGLVLPMVAI